MYAPFLFMMVLITQGDIVCLAPQLAHFYFEELQHGTSRPVIVQFELDGYLHRQHYQIPISKKVMLCTRLKDNLATSSMHRCLLANGTHICCQPQRCHAFISVSFVVMFAELLSNVGVTARRGSLHCNKRHPNL